jgi:hypothetical protein
LPVVHTFGLKGIIMRSVHTQRVHSTDTLLATRGIAGEHSSSTVDTGAFGLTNCGSRGITGMVGERSTQTDDAVTIRSTGEGHWLLRRRVVL